MAGSANAERPDRSLRRGPGVAVRASRGYQVRTWPLGEEAGCGDETGVYVVSESRQWNAEAITERGRERFEQSLQSDLDSRKP